MKDRAKSSVFSLLRKTGSVGDPRTDSDEELGPDSQMIIR